MNVAAKIDDSFALYDADLAVLRENAQRWADTTEAERIAILKDIKERTAEVAQGWAETAGRKKMLPDGSPLVGEEWISGPYALMSTCDGFVETLEGMGGRAFLKGLSKRTLPSGQLAVQVMPHTVWDHLLLSGISAEVWMQDGVTEANLAEHAAASYSGPREGRVALVLGAGNIAAISPLDCFQKLFVEHQVVLLKMNPVNDYLTDFLNAALKPLVDFGAVRIVRGDGAAGAYLTDHPEVDEIHITGATATHDIIVWGPGEEGAKNKAAGTPKNTRHITSELGAVCPTIVVPGPWSAADIKFQAANIATQKLHNSGFNCIACQVLVLPSDWSQRDALMGAVSTEIGKNTRPAYYPGAEARIDAFAAQGEGAEISRGSAPAMPVRQAADEAGDYHAQNEVFAPAMSVKEIAGEGEAYLRAAIAYANDVLYGTLGASILIHPKTIKAIGEERFDEIVSELRYGSIGINAWMGAGFLLTRTPWGAFPGHTLDDVQSGIGTVHNSFMFDSTERTVVRAPWAPFPRSFAVGEFSLLPNPPWFINNRTADKTARGLVGFLRKPSIFKLPGIFWNALRG
ncbi:MAG: aldehyde dehydrogenase family protein [Pseudomonadota bacterium]